MKTFSEKPTQDAAKSDAALKTKEKQLKDSEMKYRRLFEAAQDGILILNGDTGHIMDANPFVADLLGYRRTELLGKRLWEIGAFKDIDASKISYTELQKKNYIRYDYLPLETKDKRLIDVEFVSNVYQVDGSRIIQCNIRDVSEHKKLDLLLRRKSEESEQQFRSFMENAPDGVYLSDIDGNFLYGNLMCEKITGYRREELVGKNLLELNLLPEEGIRQAAKLLRDNIEGKSTGPDDMVLIKKDGSPISVEITTSVLRPHGQAAVLCFIRDITRRKKADAEIAHLASFPENNPNLVIEINSDGKISYMNPAARLLYPDMASLGMSHPFLAGAEDLHKEFRDGKTRTITRQLKIADTWWQQTILLDSSVGNIRLYGSDITERELANQNLRESEQKYRSLVTQSPDGIFIVNLKGTFLAVNRIMCENLKYSEEELLSMSIWDIVPEQYRYLHEKRIADILMGKTPNSAAEYLVKGKDGNLHYVEILSAPYYEGKELIGFQGIARDITERKKAEDTLKESEAKYRAVIEAAVDQIFVIDSEMKILSMNSFAAGFFHKKPEDMVGKSLTEIFPGQVAARTSANIRKVFETGTNTIMEEVLTFGDKNVWNSTSLSPMKDLNGKVIAVIGIVRDITAGKQYEKELIKSHQKTKKTLDDAINTMAKIVEMRDPYTSGHQQRVAELATAIAREMGCGVDQIEQLRMAATIHDIGKIYVPSDILSKPGKISADEFNLIKTHAQGGYDIAKGMDFPCSIADSILQHHERLDGSGYPNSLKGEQICLEAKILSVSDVVEAMSSHRPYRAKLGIDKGLEEISENRGKLYDADVVDACIKLFNSGKFEFKPVVRT
ncbi:MAG: PAS domain S-box protein [Dehalococcoidia bacterium]